MHKERPVDRPFRLMCYLVLVALTGRTTRRATFLTVLPRSLAFVTVFTGLFAELRFAFGADIFALAGLLVTPFPAESLRGSACLLCELPLECGLLAMGFAFVADLEPLTASF